jgi:hypothetical protein
MIQSVGELRYLWQRGWIEDRLCGCGEPFSSCPFWTSVIDGAFGGRDRVDPAQMIEAQRRGTRIRHLPWLLRARVPADGGAHGYGPAMIGLYAAIRDISRSAVVVDSSKLPSYGRTVDLQPGIEMSVLHLVRDPRATAYSWMRKRELPDRPGQLMLRQQPSKSAALWMVWNWTTERLWAGADERYLRIRYEDFVAAPRDHVDAILRFAHVQPASTPFVSTASVELRPTHSVAGNPSRFKTGSIEIHADDEWRTRMPRHDRRIVERITGPLIRRYGYEPGTP